jgi:hypothetical protein
VNSDFEVIRNVSDILPAFETCFRNWEDLLETTPVETTPTETTRMNTTPINTTPNRAEKVKSWISKLLIITFIAIKF